MKINQRNHEIAEAAMKRLKLGWTVEKVTLAEIDLKAGRENNARPMSGHKLNSDQVAVMVLEMERGDYFPMPVLMRVPSRKLLQVAGGNHRLGAYEQLLVRGEDLISCYVVSTSDDQVIDVLPRELNLSEGNQTTLEERISHAVYYSQNYNVKPTEADKKYGLKEGTTATKLRIASAHIRLKELGMPSDKINNTIVGVIGSLPNDNVAKSLAKLVIDSRVMTITDVNAIVKAVKIKRTESDQLQEIKSQGKMWTSVFPDSKSKNTMAERSKFFQCITVLINRVDGKKTFAQFGITGEEDRTNAKAKIQRAINLLKSLR